MYYTAALASSTTHQTIKILLCFSNGRYQMSSSVIVLWNLKPAAICASGILLLLHPFCCRLCYTFNCCWVLPFLPTVLQLLPHCWGYVTRCCCCWTCLLHISPVLPRLHTCLTAIAITAVWHALLLWFLLPLLCSAVCAVLCCALLQLPLHEGPVAYTG